MIDDKFRPFLVSLMNIAGPRGGHRASRARPIRLLSHFHRHLFLRPPHAGRPPPGHSQENRAGLGGCRCGELEALDPRPGRELWYVKEICSDNENVRIMEF